MAADDEILRLVLQIQGQEQAEALRKSAAALREQIVGMGAAASAGDPKVAALATQLKNASDEADRLDRAFGTARGGLAGFGQAGLQAGRVIQDFAQGGIGGILNNIEGLAQSLGGGPGLAGILTILGVAVFALKPMFLGLFDGADEKVRPFSDVMERLKDRIKELNDKPIKLAVDRLELQAAQDDLKRLTEAQEAYNTAKTGKSKAQRDSEAQIKELIAEAGGEDVTTRLKAPIVREMLANDDKLREAREAVAERQENLKGVEKGPAEGEDAVMWAERLEQATASLRTAEEVVKSRTREITAPQGLAEKAAGGLLLGDPKRLADALQKAGLGDLAANVRGATPEDMKAKKKIDQDNQAELDNIEAAQKIGAETSKAKADAAKDENKRIADDRKKTADALQDRFDRAMADGNRPGLPELSGELKALGKPADEDSTIAVGNLLMAKFRDTLTAKKGALGPDATDDEALDALKKEQADKDAAKARKAAAETPEQKAARRAKEQADKRADADAKRLGSAGGLDEQAEAFLAFQAQRRAGLQGLNLNRATRRFVIAQARAAGDPFLSDEQARAQAAGMIEQGLGRAGATDEDGAPLSPERRRAAARAMMADLDAKAGRRRLVDLSGPGETRDGRRKLPGPGGLRSMPAIPGPGPGRQAGDANPADEKLEKNTDATVKLTERLDRLAENGVPLLVE